MKIEPADRPAKYPSLTINLPHLRNNIRVIRELCESRGIHITAVTKVFEGDPRIAQVLVEEGLTTLGDSRVDNLEFMKDVQAKDKWLIRPPMLSEIPRLVKYGTASLNSELAVIEAINEECGKQGKRHKIILMADLGDIREGFVDYDEMIEVAKKVVAMPNVDLYGIGVNLTCFSFVQYDTEKLTELVQLKKRVEEATGVKLQVVSGGNSATLDLMLRGGIPEGVNNLRLGEIGLVGRANYGCDPDFTHRDVFTLRAEVVECRDKPSFPVGQLTVDAFGHVGHYEDRGIRRRALIAVGKVDYGDPADLKPRMAGVEILGASSDHTILDVEAVKDRIKVGDILEFDVNYGSLVNLTNTPGVELVTKE